jgi:hypothetical protein
VRSAADGGREGDGEDGDPIELEERRLRGSFGDAELKRGERRAEDANLLADDSPTMMPSGFGAERLASEAPT